MSMKETLDALLTLDLKDQDAVVAFAKEVTEQIIQLTNDKSQGADELLPKFIELITYYVDIKLLNKSNELNKVVDKLELEGIDKYSLVTLHFAVTACLNKDVVKQTIFESAKTGSQTDGLLSALLRVLHQICALPSDSHKSVLNLKCQPLLDELLKPNHKPSDVRDKTVELFSQFQCLLPALNHKPEKPIVELLCSAIEGWLKADAQHTVGAARAVASP